jgi:hypothetical protein
MDNPTGAENPDSQNLEPILILKCQAGLLHVIPMDG